MDVGYSRMGAVGNLCKQEIKFGPKLTPEMSLYFASGAIIVKLDKLESV